MNYYLGEFLALQYNNIAFCLQYQITVDNLVVFNTFTVVELILRHFYYFKRKA